MAGAATRILWVARSAYSRSAAAEPKWGFSISVWGGHHGKRAHGHPGAWWQV